MPTATTSGSRISFRTLSSTAPQRAFLLRPFDLGALPSPSRARKVSKVPQGGGRTSVAEHWDCELLCRHECSDIRPASLDRTQPVAKTVAPCGTLQSTHHVARCHRIRDQCHGLRRHLDQARHSSLFAGKPFAFSICGRVLMHPVSGPWL